MYAALNRNEPVVTVLLETNEVNLYKTDTSGRTALSLAASNGYDAIVELLDKRGTHRFHVQIWQLLVLQTLDGTVGLNLPCARAFHVLCLANGVSWAP
jgi:hypothetical protein